MNRSAVEVGVPQAGQNLESSVSIEGRTLAANSRHQDSWHSAPSYYTHEAIPNIG